MIDASIALQQKAPNFLGQLSQLGDIGLKQGEIGAQKQLASLRDIGIQSDQLKLNSENLAAESQTHYRAAMAAAVDPQTGQVNRGVLLSTLGKLDPTLAAQTAQSLDTQDAATAQAKMQIQNATLAHATLVNATMDKVLQGVKDPISYANAIQSAKQLGIPTDGMPQQYDPEFVARMHQQVLSTQDMLKQKNEEVTQAQAAQSEKDRAAQAAATLANTSAYQRAELGQGQQRIGIEGAKLNLERQKFAADQSANGQNADGAGLVDAIGTGKIAIDRLGYLVAKNPGLLTAVAQKYPDFDSSKAASYVQAYKDFTSSKTNSAGGALNAGATALGHMAELRQLNTIESRIPGTADYQRYQNKVNTLAPELAKFYGDSTVSGIENFKKTLSATFNRDAAITEQAKSMGDKFDSYQQTWENAAPSKAYESPMPGISPAAMKLRESLDSRYKAPGSSGGSMVTMKAPNGQTTQVPSDQVEHYKAKGAMVVK